MDFLTLEGHMKWYKSSYEISCKQKYKVSSWKLAACFSRRDSRHQLNYSYFHGDRKRRNVCLNDYVLFSVAK